MRAKTEVTLAISDRTRELRRSNALQTTFLYIEQCKTKQFETVELKTPTQFSDKAWGMLPAHNAPLCGFTDVSGPARTLNGF